MIIAYRQKKVLQKCIAIWKNEYDQMIMQQAPNENIKLLKELLITTFK